MDRPPAELETIFKTRKHRECREASLVLATAGIVAKPIHQGGWWLLEVSRADAQSALAELKAYREENPSRPTLDDRPTAIYEGAAFGATLYAVVIMMSAVLATRFAFGLDWVSAGQVHAERVVSGEWWRTVTALTLHIDAGHLAGNLIFGGIFGLLAGRLLGGGVAWFGILIGGALGNYVNSIIQHPNHTSIGASTAVFAALGVIISHALSNQPSSGERPLKYWSPLIGGILLFAFIGVGGERTDVGAHVTGMLAGMLVGWAGCRLPSHWLSSRALQITTGSFAIAILLVAWTAGLLMTS